MTDKATIDQQNDDLQESNPFDEIDKINNELFDDKYSALFKID